MGVPWLWGRCPPLCCPTSLGELLCASLQPLLYHILGLQLQLQRGPWQEVRARRSALPCSLAPFEPLCPRLAGWSTSCGLSPWGPTVCPPSAFHSDSPGPLVTEGELLCMWPLCSVLAGSCIPCPSSPHTAALRGSHCSAVTPTHGGRFWLRSHYWPSPIVQSGGPTHLSNSALIYAGHPRALGQVTTLPSAPNPQPPSVSSLLADLPWPL